MAKFRRPQLSTTSNRPDFLPLPVCLCIPYRHEEEMEFSPPPFLLLLTLLLLTHTRAYTHEGSCGPPDAASPPPISLTNESLEPAAAAGGKICNRR